MLVQCVVCPGYCATDLNHNNGLRPASKGGESVSWPVLNQSEAESGQFYQDGHTHPYSMTIPQWAADGFKKFDEHAAQAKAQGK